MNVKELIESGLLELYVLGQLSREEIKIVEKGIAESTEVKKELNLIEETLGKYAAVKALNIQNDVLGKTLEQINTQNAKGNNIKRENDFPSTNWIGPLSAIATVLALIFGIVQFVKNQQLTKELLTVQTECEEYKNILDKQTELYAAIIDVNSRTLSVKPTDKYNQTDLMIHINDVAETNYLQIRNLPRISDGYTFQLWSLKGNNPPIPLSIFIDNGEVIIPIDYEQGTNAYAITIEPSGGSPSPNLDELIGVFTLG